MDKVTGHWKKLHSEELHNLYSSPNIIRMINSRRMIWAGHVVRIGETRNAHTILAERREEKRPLGRPRRRRENNIKMNLKGIVGEGVDCIHLAQDRDRRWAVANTVMNILLP
jgi:hypothetical protein